MHNQSLAKSGELKAVEYLKKKGFKILEKNFRCVFGEIDIIAQDKKTICFVEVKSRSSDQFGQPVEAIGKIKRRHIVNCANVYLKKYNLMDRSARFDVVSILNDEIKLIKNAFTLNDL